MADAQNVSVPPLQSVSAMCGPGLADGYCKGGQKPHTAVLAHPMGKLTPQKLLHVPYWDSVYYLPHCLEVTRTR